MKSWLMCLLLLAAPALAGAPGLQIFTARAEGSLTVGADGRVLAVKLTSEEALGEGVLAGFEERIRAWRFDPITEDGRPVNVEGRMSLALVAAREKNSRTATYGIRHVQFLDPPVAVGDRGALPARAMPVFPSNAARLGIGADVGLLLKLGEGGRVEAAAVERLALLGVSAQQRRQGAMARLFSASAESVAMQWTFPGHAPGEVMRVPIRYVMRRSETDSGSGWLETVVQDVEPPEWVLLERAAEQAVDLDASGVALSTRLTLLTPLDDV